MSRLQRSGYASANVQKLYVHLSGVITEQNARLMQHVAQCMVLYEPLLLSPPEGLSSQIWDPAALIALRGCTTDRAHHPLLNCIVESRLSGYGRGEQTPETKRIQEKES